MHQRALLVLLAFVAGAAIGAAAALWLDLLYPSGDHPRSGKRPPQAARPGRIPTARLVLLTVATAALWAIGALRAQDVRDFTLLALSGAALLTLSATDFERHLLPNRLMYPCLGVALAISAAWPHRPSLAALVSGGGVAAWPPWVAQAAGSFLAGLAGGIVGGGIMLAVFLILPGFGFGDVKLGLLIGLIVGFPSVLTALLIGMVLGGIGAAGMLVSGRVRLRNAIAYGPYLAGGAILEMLWRH